MYKETLLMMPGPVPMPDSVRAAMLPQAINHRSKQLGGIYADIVRGLKPAFGTQNEILVLSGSGTAGQEAAIGSFAAGKKIASLVNGKFGERLGLISKIYGSAHAFKGHDIAPVLQGVRKHECNASGVLH